MRAKKPHLLRVNKVWKYINYLNYEISYILFWRHNRSTSGKFMLSTPAFLNSWTVRLLKWDAPTHPAGTAPTGRQCLSGNVVSVVRKANKRAVPASGTELISQQALGICLCGARKSRRAVWAVAVAKCICCHLSEKLMNSCFQVNALKIHVGIHTFVPEGLRLH